MITLDIHLLIYNKILKKYTIFYYYSNNLLFKLTQLLINSYFIYNKSNFLNIHLIQQIVISIDLLDHQKTVKYLNKKNFLVIASFSIYYNKMFLLMSLKLKKLPLVIRHQVIYKI